MQNFRTIEEMFLAIIILAGSIDNKAPSTARKTFLSNISIKSWFMTTITWRVKPEYLLPTWAGNFEQHKYHNIPRFWVLIRHPKIYPNTFLEYELPFPRRFARLRSRFADFRGLGYSGRLWGLLWSPRKALRRYLLLLGFLLRYGYFDIRSTYSPNRIKPFFSWHLVATCTDFDSLLYI